jgi:hypothetical protein
LSDHPAFARDRGATGVPSLKTTSTTATDTGVITTTTTTSRVGEQGEHVIETVHVEESVEFDRPNPYRYSKDLFLSLWKEEPAAPGPEGLDHVWCEDVQPIVATAALSEQEQRIFASGTVNSDITRRMTGGRGGERRTSNTRGGGRSNSRDFEEGFRKFVSKAQTTEERPVWSYPVGALGHFNQGTYAYGGRPGAAPIAEDPADVLWFYRDPQGNIQGPFTGADMHEWYKAGFFTAQLLVKRESDPDFQALGVLVQVLGNDEEPFLLPAPGTIPAGMTAAEY